MAIWVPVVNVTHFHTVTVKAQTQLQPLDWVKHDFGITAIIVMTIIASIARTTMTGIALMQTAITVEILDKMVSLSEEALQTQELFMIRNMTLLAYDPRFMSIGLALYHVNTTSQARTQLAQYIKGLWLVEF